ncbi:MAG: Maf family protein [Candidatus Aenigmarchaeota archaeon]|nr:Maf family protein [Candidatus Aenigmarchaeota archaeon]
MKIILATASPYRKRAFAALGIPFTAEGSGVEEDFEGRPGNPEELVLVLAKKKAEAVAKNHREGIVIGFDSVGLFEGAVLEKPESEEELFERLKDLSGKSHEFITGVHMINVSSGRFLSKAVKTKAFFRVLKDEEIKKYISEDPDYGTFAVGYDPWNHISSSFAERIEGSYHNLISGVPLEAIVEMLYEMGFRLTKN